MTVKFYNHFNSVSAECANDALSIYLLNGTINLCRNYQQTLFVYSSQSRKVKKNNHFKNAQQHLKIHSIFEK